LLFHLDGVSVGLLLSSGYLLAVGANLLGGYLMDRFDKWLVLFFLEVLIVPAALLMNLHSLMAFRVCAALIIALSFTATNAGYGTAGDVVKGMQTANVMGIVSLGAGVFGYLGPQLLGILKDVSGTFAAGWCFIAAIAAATAIGAILLRNVRWDTPSSAPNAIS
jgi:MFS family permease